jgi:hypothetical protein
VGTLFSWENKMFKETGYEKILFILLFAFSTIGIYGCSQKEYFSNNEEKNNLLKLLQLLVRRLVSLTTIKK